MLRVSIFAIISAFTSQVLSQEISIEGELYTRNQCTVIEKLEQSAILSCPGGITTRRLFNSAGDLFVVQKKISDDFLVSDSERKLQLYDQLTDVEPQLRVVPTGVIHKVEKAQLETFIYVSLFAYQKSKWENDAFEVPNKLTVETDRLRSLPLDFIFDFKFNEKFLLSLQPKFSRDGGEIGGYYGFGKFWLGAFTDVAASKNSVKVQAPDGSVTTLGEVDTLELYSGLSMRLQSNGDRWNFMGKLNIGYYREELDSSDTNEDPVIDALVLKADLLIHHKINKHFAIGAGIGLGFGAGQLKVKNANEVYYDDVMMFNFQFLPLNIMATF